MYVFIGGIPAAGKSYLAKELAEKYEYKTTINIEIYLILYPGKPKGN